MSSGWLGVDFTSHFETKNRVNYTYAIAPQGSNGHTAMDIPVVANVLGTLGAVCWSVQLLPQIWLNWRRHNATGLQPTMVRLYRLCTGLLADRWTQMMFWAWAGVPLGVYNIVSDFNVALQIQPQILAMLSLATWIQCFYYERHWRVSKSLGVVLPIAVVMAGIEVGLIFALRVGVRRDVQWPVTLMAVLAALFLALGVLSHYWDIWRHRTVRGISFVFVGIDAMGDLTSLLSVLFQPDWDVLGLVIYGTELVLWIGVFAAGGYYNLVPWIKSRVQKREGRKMEGREGVAMYEMSSSTSVFRTPSGNVRERNITTGTEGP